MFFRNWTRAAFQEKHFGIEQRWSIISAHLPRHKSWILDVGSNLGDTARRAAEIGHIVVGVEVERHLVERAVRKIPDNVALMVGRADPPFFESMPPFGAVLLLSVIHRIWAVGGRSFAEECMRSCMQKTNLIIMEGAVRHRRYIDHGKDPPDFESNNLDAGIAWHLQWLRTLADSSRSWRIESVGHVPHSTKEPYRPLFVLSTP
jgi:SAM-dependent methyltransferase